MKVELKKEDFAMFNQSLPVNPIPFCNRIIELKKQGLQNNHPLIKCNLYCLISMILKDQVNIDMLDLYQELNRPVDYSNIAE